MSIDARLGKRKTVNMNEDVAQELNRLANSSGKTLYSLTNEIGVQALEASKQGFGLEDAIDSKKLLHSARKSRFVMVNQDLWYFASSQAMRHSKREWLKLIRDSSQWTANVFLDGTSTENFVASFRKFLADFFWDCSKAELIEQDGGGKLSLKIAFVPEMPLDHTQGLFKQFEAVFNVHGYVATSSMVEAGYMSLEFKKMSASSP